MKWLSDNIVEHITAMLLGLATVCSAWSAYQAQLWGGVQTFELNRAGAARIESSRLDNLEMLGRLSDMFIINSYMSALENHDVNEMKFWEMRMRPQLKAVFDEWLATDPKKNPNAPRGPYLMPQYSSPEIQKSMKATSKTELHTTQATTANEQSDKYILFTVVFSAVLFFAGIATKFSTPHLMNILMLAASAIWLIATIALFFQPIARN